MQRLLAALVSSGRADQATVAAREWLRTNTSDALIAESLAQLDLAARRFFEAEKQLQIVLAQRPSDASALNNLAWTYQQRNDSRARQVAQKSYLLNPTPESADTLGWILTTSGSASTGLALLRQAAVGLPRDPTVSYHLAVALKETDHRDEAVKVLRPIVQGLLDFDDRPAAAKLLEELAPG
jgi:Flp pilus assembly protein TadD